MNETLATPEGKAADGTGLFSGVLVPVLMPFGPDLSPDVDKFVAFCRWLLAEGANGLAVFGTTSEATSLSLAERKTLLEALVDSGVSPARLMPGTGLSSFTETVELTAHAVSLGCRGVLMLPPFYYKNPSDDGLFASFSEVIQRVGDARLRIYLYHFPAMSAVPIGLKLVGRLLTDYPDAVVGLKDSSGSWDNMSALIREFPGFAVFPGTETYLLDGLKAGAAGCISATANVNVRAIRALIDAFPGAGAEELSGPVVRVRKAIEQFPTVAGLKSLLAHGRGDESWRTVRPPLTALPDDEAAKLRAAAQGAGFDPASLHPQSNIRSD